MLHEGAKLGIERLQAVGNGAFERGLRLAKGLRGFEQALVLHRKLRFLRFCEHGNRLLRLRALLGEAVGKRPLHRGQLLGDLLFEGGGLARKAARQLPQAQVLLGSRLRLRREEGIGEGLNGAFVLLLQVALHAGKLAGKRGFLAAAAAQKLQEDTHNGHRQHAEQDHHFHGKLSLLLDKAPL